MVFFRDFRLGILALALSAGATNVYAQCVVGGTDFDTPTSLFNPTMENDANEVNGWYSPDLGDLLEEQCGSCSYFGFAYDAIQKGMPTNVIASGASMDAQWDDFVGKNISGETQGFGAIVANPRVISPYLSEGSGSNMFVAYGNGANNNVLQYTISGLAPGSDVEVTVDVYNLFSMDNLSDAVLAMNEGASPGDYVTELKLPGGMTFVMQKRGSELDPTNVNLNGNKPSVTVCTGLNYGQPAGDRVSTGATTFNWGANEKLTLPTKASATGTVTLYFKTASAFAPIGIDNITVTGKVKPEIRSQKQLPVCPANPVLLTLKSGYPDGTTYKWTTPDGSYTTKNCTFEPKDANTSYKITCEVKLPGCTAESAEFELTTKTCCSMTGEDGKEYPMALTNIFYDDFGRFLDANTYEYTDAKGNVYTEPTTGIYGAGDQKRASCTMQPGAKFNAAIKPCSATGSLNDSYAITNINPYNPGVQGDASGDPMGCMLTFDLSGTACNGVPVKDMVVYEREVCGLCKGKEITFSAKFGAINNQPPVGELAVILRKNDSSGDILWQDSEILQGSKDWIEKGTTFEITETDVNCVVMQVVNKQAQFGNSQGDYAIDDIIFTVCTPPDVAVDAELTNGTDLLDLCTDEILTLKAEISESAKNFYGSTLGYLYQYSYDPEDPDGWKDLGEIQSDGNFVINGPANHDAFKPLMEDPSLKGLNIYFRVVIGKSEYLSEERDTWATMDAQSPCRAISISSIPIVAALNCAACSKPDPLTFDAEGGIFDAKKKTVSLCPNGSTVLSAGSVHGKDKDGNDYYDYDVKWFKEVVGSAALEVKKCTSDDAVIPTVTVDYEDVEAAGETGVKYIVSLHDYFDPTLATTQCDITDTITVIALPQPEDKLTDPEEFCEGTGLKSEPILTISNKEVIWYDSETDTSTAGKSEEALTQAVIEAVEAAASPKAFYYVVQDEHGCRSEVNPYTVTVNPIPDALVTSGVQYLKADLLKNLEDGDPFKSLEAQNSEVVSGSETGATVMWMGPFAGQEGVEAEQPAKGTPSSDEYVMFELADITDGSKDELYYYWVYQKSAEGCEGDTVKIQVDVLGAPAPETSDTTYCLGGTSATLEANSFVNTQVASADKYGLKWYDSNGNELEDSFLPPTDEVGETTYYVSQYDLENPDNESKKMPIVVTVVGVKEPEFKDLVTEYCSGDKASDLPNTLTKEESKYYFASEVVWYKEAEAGSLDSAATYPIDTDVTETKTYDFTAKQKYTIAESGEVCVSDAAEFSITVNFSPAAKDTTISYLSSDATSEKDKNGDNLFESIADKGWKEEPGYTYKYVVQGTTDTTTTPPRPACDTASLDGTTKTITYEVYRINNSTSCRSEVSTIKVTISDALPPLVNDVLYCEGEDLQALTAKVQKQGSKEEDDYTILWYGTTEPASTAEAEAEQEGSTYPLTGKATVKDDKLTEVTYWVAQRDETTGAVSSAVPLKVVVYPNPDLTITDPAAVCEKEVDLASAVTLTNEVDGKTYTKSYFLDAEGETQLEGGSKVSGSNTYYVQYAYDAKVASGNTCKSEIEPIKVQIDTLTMIAEDVSTCPKMTATFTAQAKTNVETVTYKWSGPNSDSGTGAEFTTQAFDGDYGASYDYKLVVTAGTCTETKDLKVTLGEGPVVGTLELADATNTSLDEVVYANSNTSEPYYFCDAVTVTPKYDDTSDKNNVKPVSEYTLSKGDAIINAPYELNEAGKYTLSFVNGCPTKVEFELIDASVEITSLKSSKLEICEGEEFSSSITVAPQNSIGYTVTWKKDGVALDGETGEIYKIETTEPSHSGLYSVEVNRKGCVAKEEVGELQVKPYIKLIEDKDPKIIRRGEPVSLSLKVKEPTDVSDLNVVWKDNGSAVSEAEDKLSYEIAEVTKDYEFSIDLSGDGLCPASTEMTVWVDADLQLTTELSDTLCEDLDYTMTIDTAGTGKFRQQGVTPTLKVIREMGGATLDVSDDVKFKNGKLELTLTAEKDATYKAVFTYGDQEEKSSELAIVIPSIKATSPETPTICDGEEVVLAFTNVTPEGTVIKWANDNTIMSKTEDGKSATVAPKYNKTAGAGHQSVYAYDVEAYNKTCDSYLPITVTVKVDEPLSGSITGDSPICEGSSSLLSASSYDAETYQWTTSGTTVGTTADITVYPPVTTQYNLNMTRGRCEANDQYTVTVTSNPEIISVDSVGVRDVEIVVDPSKGTGLFSYWLDGDQETMTTNTLIKDLTFASHLITVVDANGCTSNFNFSIEPPKISIPIHFSPNGDGVNDRWVISTLSEVYPNAVVRIYDRFGKLLAEYLGADEGWDGTYNGVKMMSTDYWYVVEIEEIATKYEGHFTLIRR